LAAAARPPREAVRAIAALPLARHAGRAGHFAAVHHFDGDRLEITAHRCSEPGEVLCRCTIARGTGRIEGPPSPWEHLPRHYVTYFVRPAWSDFALVTVNTHEAISIQTFDWYDESYDKDYQGIVGVTEVPGSNLVLVSVQRSSKPILYDPDSRCKVGELALAGHLGNPRHYFRHREPELWADDYDTLLKIELGTWRVLRSRRVQRAAAGTGQFIGQWAFDRDESLCAVARPYSGDVIGLSPNRLGTKYRAKLERQPFEVALLRDLRVRARLAERRASQGYAAPRLVRVMRGARVVQMRNAPRA
jgi:hypothetical protein